MLNGEEAWPSACCKQVVGPNCITARAGSALSAKSKGVYVVGGRRMVTRGVLDQATVVGGLARSIADARTHYNLLRK